MEEVDIIIVVVSTVCKLYWTPTLLLKYFSGPMTQETANAPEEVHDKLSIAEILAEIPHLSFPNVDE